MDTKKSLLLLLLFNQHNDYIYDMNTYNVLSLIGEGVNFLTLSVECHTREEIIARISGLKKLLCFCFRKHIHL